MQNYIVNMIEENKHKIDVNKPKHFLRKAFIQHDQSFY